MRRVLGGSDQMLRVPQIGVYIYIIIKLYCRYHPGGTAIAIRFVLVLVLLSTESRGS